jgi:uncharacterized protein (DUF433 family)
MMVTEKYVQQREGNWYVGSSRVEAYSVIAVWQRGCTPEQVQRSFPSLPLVAVYATIAYYLEHQTEMDAFFREVDALGEKMRAEAEAANPEFYARMRERFARYRAEHPEITQNHAGDDECGPPDGPTA